MIQINKASINTVVLTLTEKVTLPSPKFLFEFKNDQTNELIYFIAADVSSYTDRYNKFLIEETATENLLIGKVELSLTGFYSYRVFEQTSTTNLDPALSDNTTPLEYGKVLVIGTSATEYEHTYNPTIVVYNP
jgi:hypothetical protein